MVLGLCGMCTAYEDPITYGTRKRYQQVGQHVGSGLPGRGRGDSGRSSCMCPATRLVLHHCCCCSCYCAWLHQCVPCTHAHAYGLFSSGLRCVCVSAGKGRYKLMAADLVATHSMMDHIGRYLPSVRMNGAAFSFVVDLIINYGSPVLHLVMVRGGLGRGEGGSTGGGTAAWEGCCVQHSH